MSIKEAIQIFLSRGNVEVQNGTIYDPNKWIEACLILSKLLQENPQLNEQQTNEAINLLQKKIYYLRKDKYD